MSHLLLAFYAEFCSTNIKTFLKMKNYSLSYSIIIGCILLSLGSCKKKEQEDLLPTPTPTNTAPTAITFDVSPANGATDINSPLTISWLSATDPDGDAITYDVYFGSNSSNLNLVSENQTTLNYVSGVLELGTTYYFKVVSKAGEHQTESETRNFVTSTTGSFTDSRDGHTYGTKLIGSQIWMTENLIYNSTGSYSYNDLSSNDANYGRLYEWSNVSAAIPQGWHLPTDDEWKTLETHLGMSPSDLNINDYSTSRGTDQGTQLLAGGSSGLDFPLAGFRANGSYSALDDRTYIWVNSESSPNQIYRRRLQNGNPSCYRFANPASGFAISVRLVKD